MPRPTPQDNSTHVSGGWTASVTREASSLYLSPELVEEAATEDGEACRAKCVGLKAACLAWAWCPKTETSG